MSRWVQQNCIIAGWKVMKGIIHNIRSISPTKIYQRVSITHTPSSKATPHQQHRRPHISASYNPAKIPLT